ncbi:MAG: hypothetical protein ACO1SX_11645 [Actinomycetota bacterium]
MLVKTTNSPETEARSLRAILLWALGIGSLIGLLAAVVLPFFVPIYAEVSGHRFCLVAGTPMKAEEWRFALGFTYGGDPKVVQIGDLAWVFYWY